VNLWLKNLTDAIHGELYKANQADDQPIRLFHQAVAARMLLIVYRELDDNNISGDERALIVEWGQETKRACLNVWPSD